MSSATALMRLLLVSAYAFACATEAAEGMHDGAWWRDRNVATRTGYAAGFMDCATFDARSTLFHSVSWDALQAKVTEYFLAHPGARGRSVAEVMKEVAPRHRVPPIEGGETHPGKHGLFDGNYWRMLKPDQQLGFVQGYVDCLSSEKVRSPAFSRPATWYRSRITEWFGTTAEDQGTIRVDREDEKIANVLWRLGD